MTPTYDLLSRQSDFQLGNAGTAKDFQGCGQVVTQMPGRLAQAPETSQLSAGAKGLQARPVHPSFTAGKASPARA
jgi:hypothetical protein